MASDTLGGFDGATLPTGGLAYARVGWADRAIIAQGLGTHREAAGGPALDPDAIERFANAPAQARQEAAR
jgi:hypothetical protein